MSTRATYRILERQHKEPIVTYFYIHHDGYPEGALSYFRDLFKFRDLLKKIYEKCPGDDYSKYIERKSWASIFELGLVGAVKTIDHEYHFDTEYCYNLYFSKEELEQISFTGNAGTFIGTYKEFEKKYSPKENQ